MHIAVIGGGVLGTSELAEFGRSVTLLERLPALMQNLDLSKLPYGVRGRRAARGRQRLFHRA